MVRFHTVVFCLLLLLTNSFGQIPDKELARLRAVDKAGSPQKNSLSQFYGVLQGFDMKVWMGNMSVMGLNYDGSSGTPTGYGLEYPSGGGIEHLYGAAPWIGALIDTSTSGTPRIIKAVTTGYEGWAGPLFELHGNPDGSDSFFTTSTNTLNGHNRKGYDDDGDGRIDEDELDGKDNDLDGFIDEDYGALSESDMYVSYGDFNNSTPIAGHVPLGIKVWQKSLAWQTFVKEPILPIEYYFINVGNKILRDVYVGFFADCDVGPRSVSSYYTRNYSAYLPDVRTAYVQNPIDRPSTPIGLTVLQTPKALTDTSLKYTFQWYPGSQSPVPDNARYNLMAKGEIKPDEYPVLSDTRFFFSFGTFDSLKPGDTLKIVVAWVSGQGITTGPNNLHDNAQKAISIYNSGYFVPPVLTVSDSGNGIGLLPHWSAAHTLGGSISSYKLFYGTSSLTYTDSIETADTSIGISGFTKGATYYFSVLAIDNIGNRSSLSNEVAIAPSVAPHPPRDIIASGYETAIEISWPKNADIDLAGYHLYRYTSLDTTVIKLHSGLLYQPVYLDLDVWGDRIYYYKVKAIDLDGNESNFSEIAEARLIPPMKPTNVISGPGKNFIRLVWYRNTEFDLKGYNIFRSIDSVSGYSKINSDLVLINDFKDSTIQEGITYYYTVTAVDSTASESDTSSRVDGHTVSMNQGILAVNYNTVSRHPSRDSFYRWLLQGYATTVDTFAQIADTSSVYKLAKYSTVLWLMERNGVPTLSIKYPIALLRFVLGGGKLLIMFESSFATGNISPLFLWDLFGYYYYIPNPCPFFLGAGGIDNFPNVKVDPSKGGPVGNDFVNGALDSSKVIYFIYAVIDSPGCSNMPVGYRSLTPSTQAYLMTFPLYYLDSSSAKGLMTKVLTNFGEVPLGVSDDQQPLPQEFQLYPAYPNPFNPTTKIKYSLPSRQNVSLKIYDILGREVMTLASGVQLPGTYEVVWDAARCASGVYFYRLQTDNFVDVKKVVLMK